MDHRVDPPSPRPHRAPEVWTALAAHDAPGRVGAARPGVRKAENLETDYIYISFGDYKPIDYLFIN